MASYVLKHSRTTVSVSGTSYSTVTSLLTVAASHLYIIKGVKQRIEFSSVNSGTLVAGSNLTLTDTDGTSNSAIITASPYVTSAGAIASPSTVIYDWACPTATGNAEEVFLTGTPTQAIGDNTLYTFKSSALRDLHMEAGQILKFVPRGANPNTSWSAAGTITASITFDISYIDYTL